MSMSPVAPQSRLRLAQAGDLREGPHLAKVRRQAAVVRALIDHVERQVPDMPQDHPLRTQLREELGRLSAQLDGTTDAAERSRW